MSWFRWSVGCGLVGTCRAGLDLGAWSHRVRLDLGRWSHRVRLDLCGCDLRCRPRRLACRLWIGRVRPSGVWLGWASASGLLEAVSACLVRAPATVAGWRAEGPAWWGWGGAWVGRARRGRADGWECGGSPRGTGLGGFENRPRGDGGRAGWKKMWSHFGRGTAVGSGYRVDREGRVGASIVGRSAKR